jgi:hypothetical protein
VKQSAFGFEARGMGRRFSRAISNSDRHRIVPAVPFGWVERIEPDPTGTDTSPSIWIRVTDPDFEPLDRDLLLTPRETKRSIANRDFADPILFRH